MQLDSLFSYFKSYADEEFLNRNGFFEQTVYDEDEDPSTSIEFSAGAFRVLHKQIPFEYR